jgi:hypothetical protein
MLGVRSSSKIIDPNFANYLFRIACWHCGNWLIQHLKEFIDVDVENILHREFQLRASEESSENNIKHLRHLKEVWTKSPEGGRLLQKKER